MRSAFPTIFSRVITGTALALLVAATASLSSCTPDKKSESLGALPKASFTVAPLSGKANTWVATASNVGAFQWAWDIGDGNGSKLGNQTDTIFYDSAGNYRVILTAFGHGGYDTTSQIIEVDSNAPLINQLVNGNLTSDSDWTLLNTGGTPTTINFTPLGLNFSNAVGANTNAGVYQAVQVLGGKSYVFSATVTTPGSSNTWVEFYFGTTVPVQGSDYVDNKLWSLNTYSGCGGNAETVDIVSNSCAGTGASSGVIVFPTSGTIYVVIKSGSYLGTEGPGGVNITNVVLGLPPQ